MQAFTMKNLHLDNKKFRRNCRSIKLTTENKH